MLTAMLALGGMVRPVVAVAEESSEVARLRAEADGMATTIEATTQTYRQAEADVAYLEAQIADNENRAAHIEEKLPEQRARTAACVKELYLLQQSSSRFLDLLFSAESFNQLIATIRYIDTIHERNTDQIEQLVSMTTELDRTKQELVVQRDVARQKEDEAFEALEEAREARRQLQERADAIAEAEAQERARAIAAAQAAIEAAKAQAEREAQEAKEAKEAKEAQEAQRAAEQEEQEEQSSAGEQEEAPQDTQEPQDSQRGGATFTTSSGNTAPVEVPEQDTGASTEPLTTNTTSQEESGWAARINAYLAGSPLAGYGEVFAKAAATYGVDPRFSPAISCVESGKGAICFLPHNAWGWGRSSWGDWESAINDHVAGLASGYGGTLTLEGAMRYCPPTYQEWYSSVLAEMNSI